MSDYMAQMLNELMGSQRDALPGERRELNFDDPNVCTDFLVKFCTHEIFKNTKNDLGFCKYSTHDENLRKAYSESDKKGRMGFEGRFQERIRRIHDDVQRKIARHEERLAMTQGDSKVAEENFEKKMGELFDRRETLSRKIETLMREAQVEGEKGNVEAAQSAVDRADRAQKDKDELDEEEAKLHVERDRVLNLEENVTAGSRQMQVCKVCGCFMLQNDAPQRIDDHLTGKLHIAYLSIADTLKKMDADLEERWKREDMEREERRKLEKERDRGERKREHRSDNDNERKRSRSRDRDRRDRGDRNDRSDRGDRHRDRDRDRRDSRNHRDRESDRHRSDRNHSDHDRRRH